MLITLNINKLADVVFFSFLLASRTAANEAKRGLCPALRNDPNPLISRLPSTLDVGELAFIRVREFHRGEKPVGKPEESVLKIFDRAFPLEKRREAASQLKSVTGGENLISCFSKELAALCERELSPESRSPR